MQLLSELFESNNGMGPAPLRSFMREYLSFFYHLQLALAQNPAVPPQMNSIQIRRELCLAELPRSKFGLNESHSAFDLFNWLCRAFSLQV